jgi:hypothetical protein
MGDGDRNLDKQIQRAEEKIERVEEQIDNCPNDEERKLFRGKEAYL